MIRIVITDSTAESRTNLVSTINEFLKADISALEILPQISVKPVSPQELKFVGKIEICVIGEKLIKENISEVSKIRKLLPDAVILISTSDDFSDIGTIEKLVRLGADDTISSQTSPEEFLKKLIIFCKAKKRTGKSNFILVDSSKGGLGVTSIAAGLSECISRSGKSVALLDFDFESQDLSRFLQVRPYINENLQLLLDQNRSVTHEFVEECLFDVDIEKNDGRFSVMPPVAEQDALYDGSSTYSRSLVSILELLDSNFDYIIVDSGELKGAMLRTIYKVSDFVLFVVSNDPASVYASASKIKKIKSMLSAQSNFLVLENASDVNGLSSKILRNQLSEATGIENEEWIETAIPFCKSARTWPGSGLSMFEHGSPKVVAAILKMAVSMGLISTEIESASLSKKMLSIGKNLFKRKFSETIENIKTKKRETILAPGSENKLLPNVPEPLEREFSTQPKLNSPKENDLTKNTNENNVIAEQINLESPKDVKQIEHREGINLDNLFSKPQIYN